MRVDFHSMREADVRAIAGWRYDGPYAFYDLAGEDVAEFLAEVGSYVAAEDERGELVGFFGFGAVGQVPGGQDAELYPPDALDVALGLRPDLVGGGLGPGFVAAGLAYAREHRSPAPTRFRLSVAAFNERAVRAYERVGFRRGPRFSSPVRGVATEFLLMLAAPARIEPS